MGTALLLYEELFARGTAIGADLFDLHVAASIMTLAVSEAAAEGVGLETRCGLVADEIAQLSTMLFPGWTAAAADGLDVEPQEQALRDILWMNAARASVQEHLLTRMIARRSLRPNHLWQDLGLGNRGELSQLMGRHFPRLVQRNSADMKWKKFFFRMMCSSEAFTLCAAPVCSECDDFDNCFGSEDGEALLARVANGRMVISELRT